MAMHIVKAVVLESTTGHGMWLLERSTPAGAALHTLSLRQIVTVRNHQISKDCDQVTYTGMRDGDVIAVPADPFGAHSVTAAAHEIFHRMEGRIGTDAEVAPIFLTVERLAR